MADGVNNLSSGQISNNYDKYKDMFAKEANDMLGQTDFLNLLTQQLKNQDFNNPMDNTEFIAQMAQFSQLQAIQQMTYYSRATYASSLVGKTVAVAGFDTRGHFMHDEGIVSAVRMEDEDFIFTVNGKDYTSKNIMEIKTTPEQKPEEAPETDEENPDEETEEAPENGEGGSTVTVVPDGKGGWIEVPSEDDGESGDGDWSDELNDLINSMR